MNLSLFTVNLSATSAAPATSTTASDVAAIAAAAIAAAAIAAATLASATLASATLTSAALASAALASATFAKPTAAPRRRRRRRRLLLASASYSSPRLPYHPPTPPALNSTVPFARRLPYSTPRATTHTHPPYAVLLPSPAVSFSKAAVRRILPLPACRNKYHAAARIVGGYPRITDFEKDTKNSKLATRSQSKSGMHGRGG